MRAAPSADAPGANGTMIWMGLGVICASVTPDEAVQAPTAPIMFSPREVLRPLSPPRLAGVLGVVNGAPDIVGRRRHLDVAHAEVPQRIDDGADDRGERGRGAAFAAGLDAERVGRRQHLDDLGAERRQRVGARHPVVHERADQRLAGIGLDIALLPHRLADALHDRAVGLAVRRSAD